MRYLPSLVISAVAVVATDFSGQGQIRTLWNNPGPDNGKVDLGCLTSSGKWTVNEGLCGSFAANRTGNVVGLQTAEGPCGMDNIDLDCSAGKTYTNFGAATFFAPKDILYLGEYFVWASDGNNPPLSTDAPESIGPWTDTESGKFVWLSWKSLE